MSGIGHNYNRSLNVPRELEFEVMDSDLSSHARHLVHVLTKFMNRKGEGCSPSIAYLCKATKYARPTVVKYLNEIDKWGRIRKEEGSGRRTNRYIPQGSFSSPREPLYNYHGEFTGSHYEPQSSDDVVHPVNHNEPLQFTPLTDVVHPVNSTKDITKDSKKRKNTKKEKKKSIYTSGFEEFYKAYPKHTTKAESFKEWKDLTAEDREWAIASIPAYKKLLDEDGGWRKPKDPCRYLKHRMFEDFPQDGTDPEKPWGWWRERGVEKYRGLGIDFWRGQIEKIRPNGKWPWDTLGPPPGHAECLLPKEAQTRYGDKYTEDVKKLNEQYGGLK